MNNLLQLRKKVIPYFVLSTYTGLEFSHGYLNELPENILELLEREYMLSIWDISGKNLNELIESNGRKHTSFAFNKSCNELCIGDYV